MQEQIDEMKAICPELFVCEEGKVTYYLLKNLKLPEGCAPAVVDALLRPVSGGDGYPSRLFFSAQIKGKTERNWNGLNVRILDRNWFAYSWRLNSEGQRLAQILANHLRALQ